MLSILCHIKGPAFCENPDKAVCFGDFVVPNDAPSGRVCTFMWYWIFNANTDPYTTCWEACIGGNCGGAQSPGSTAAPPQPTQPQPTQPQPTQPQPTQPQPTSFPECANLPPLRTLKPSPNMPQPTNAPPATSGACSAMYAQCGGQNWSGPTCCQPGTICQVIVRNFTLYAAVHYFNSS